MSIREATDKAAPARCHIHEPEDLPPTGTNAPSWARTLRPTWIATSRGAASGSPAGAKVDG